MKKMTRLIAMLLALLMLFSAAGCGSAPASDENATATGQAPTPEQDEAVEYGPEDLEYYTSKIVPLKEKVHLNVGVTTCVLHDFPTYLTTELGLCDEMNIETEVTCYSNGPLMVEAMAAGDMDCGGYGIGGVLSGSVNAVHDILWIRCNEAEIQKIIAKNGSALAEAPFDEAKGLRGTADDWRGKTVYCAPGTTLAYTLGTAMGKLDLTFDDLDMVYMDAQNIPTAMYAGQGDAWTLWNMYGYTNAVMEGYTEVCNAASVGISLCPASVASKKVLKDPTMKEAVYTWLECVMAVTSWMTATDENMRTAAAYYEQWCEDEGVSTGGADLYEYVKGLRMLTLEEEYDLFTKKNADGILLAEELCTAPMDFFISQGSYSEDDKALLVDGDVNPEFVELMMEKYK